jgi:aspartate racemase
MWSFDFGEIEALQSGEWDKATVLMVDAARRLEDGSTEFFLICSNTMHHKADAIAAAVEIALLRIADPTGARIARSRCVAHSGRCGPRAGAPDHL